MQTYVWKIPFVYFFIRCVLRCDEVSPTYILLYSLANFGYIQFLFIAKRKLTEKSSGKFALCVETSILICSLYVSIIVAQLNDPKSFHQSCDYCFVFIIIPVTWLMGLTHIQWEVISSTYWTAALMISHQANSVI